MASQRSRRGFLQLTAGSLGLAELATLTGCEAGTTPAPAREGKRYKAAFSNAGLQATWCSHGMETAKLWGDRLGIDIVVYDSQFSTQKQLLDIEDMVTKDWDFVAIQAYGIKTLTEPVKRLIDKGIPVVDMDTRIVPAGEDIGLWTFVTPDHEGQGAQATEAVLAAMGHKGKLVHTQGALAHSGAQLRAKGCRDVVAKYPNVEIIDEQPGDWDITMVGRIWDDLLVRHERIDGAFLHNDDMAMAAVQAIKRAGKPMIPLASIDAQEMGINGVVSGDLVVSVMNPAGRIHLTALMAGYFACAMGEKRDDVPEEIWIDNPVVTKENAESYQYLMRHKMI